MVLGQRRHDDTSAGKPRQGCTDWSKRLKGRDAGKHGTSRKVKISCTVERTQTENIAEMLSSVKADVQIMLERWITMKKEALTRSVQHGFLSSRSCLSNLLAILNVVTTVLNKNVVEAYRLDFSGVPLPMFKTFGIPHLEYCVKKGRIWEEIGKCRNNLLSSKRCLIQ